MWQFESFGCRSIQTGKLVLNGVSRSIVAGPTGRASSKESKVMIQQFVTFREQFLEVSGAAVKIDDVATVCTFEMMMMKIFCDFVAGRVTRYMHDLGLLFSHQIFQCPEDGSDSESR